MRLEISSACHAQKVRLVQWSLGEEEPRLRRVEATYRITLRQDSPDCSLLHGAESLRYGSLVFVKPPDGSCGLGHNFRPGASRTRDFHTSGFQRRGEDCNPENLAGALSGMLPQPFSILVLPPQGSIAPTSLFGHGRRWRSPAAQERSAAGTAPSKRIFAALPRHISPIFGLSAGARAPGTLFGGPQVTPRRHAQGVGPDPPDDPVGWYDPPHCPPCRVGRDLPCHEAAP